MTICQHDIDRWLLKEPSPQTPRTPHAREPAPSQVNCAWHGPHGSLGANYMKRRTWLSSILCLNMWRCAACNWHIGTSSVAHLRKRSGIRLNFDLSHLTRASSTLSSTTANVTLLSYYVLLIVGQRYIGVITTNYKSSQCDFTLMSSVQRISDKAPTIPRQKAQS